MQGRKNFLGYEPANHKYCKVAFFLWYEREKLAWERHEGEAGKEIDSYRKLQLIEFFTVNHTLAYFLVKHPFFQKPVFNIWLQKWDVL